MHFVQTNRAIRDHITPLSKQIKSPPISMIGRDLIVKNVLKIALILFLIEKEIVF